MHTRQRGSRVARTWVAVTLAAITAAGALAACGSDDEADQPSDSVTTAATGSSTDGAETTVKGDEPVTGGSLTFLNFTDTRGFDPALAQVNSQFITQNFAVYDALVLEKANTDEILFRLLESAESDDAINWTLKLHPGVTFSDGTPFDAEAVKFNWERLAAPETQAVAMRVAQSITSMTVVDATTLDVVLAAPDGQFVRTIANNALTWIASPTAIKADPAGLNAKPVGAGAYTLQEYVPGSHSTFVRNPKYYGKTYVDEFTVSIITDETQRLSALRSGDGDMLWTVNGITAAQAADAGLASTVVSPNGGYVLFFNTKRAPFDDLRVRRAFALAFDGKQLSDAVYDGQRDAPTNMFRDGSPFYDAKFNQPDADARAAQALFDEIAAERGGPLEVTLEYAAAFTPEAEWYQTKLSGFQNVKVNLSVTPNSEFQARYSSGDVTVGIFAYAFVDAGHLARYLGTGAPLNFTQTSDAALDAAFAAGAASLDDDERAEIYAPVFQHIVDEVPFKFILRLNSWQFFDGDKVHGVEDAQATGTGGLMVTEVWVTK